MTELFLIGLVAFTSLAAYTVGVRQFGLKEKSVRLALVTVLECLGTFSIFLIANLSIGVVIILLIRSITPRFVSVYLIGDVMLVYLSVIQGFVFQLWWRKQ